MIGSITGYLVLQLIRIWGLYIFRNLELHEAAWDLLKQIISVLQRCTYHRLTDEFIGQLQRDVLSMFKSFETHMPADQFDIIYHLLIHIPTQLGCWGPCRGNWTFGTERYFGWIGRAGKKKSTIAAHTYQNARRALAGLNDEDGLLADIPEEENRFNASAADGIDFRARKKTKFEQVDVEAMKVLFYHCTEEWFELQNKYTEYKRVQQQKHKTVDTLNQWLKSNVDKLTAEQMIYKDGFSTFAGKLP